MAVIDGCLVTVGGNNDELLALHEETNVILSLLPGKLHKKRWKKALPPMPTRRSDPLVVTTPTHLVVAGGYRNASLDVVEVLDTSTYQWFRAESLPQPMGYYSQRTLCAGYLYASSFSTVYSCSMEKLLHSRKSTSNIGDSVWKKLTGLPGGRGSSLVTLKEHVLTLGGRKTTEPIAAVHRYDTATSSWSVIGQLPAPLYGASAAVLSSNEVIVVDGRTVYIGQYS